MKLPNDDQRCAIIGRTGSGKTQAGIWQFSLRSYNSMPWVVFDFKRDKLIAQIPFTNVIPLGELPTQPGIYIVRPQLGQEDELEAYLWQLWNAENIGIFIDEGYMIGSQSKAFQAILTQGRSKHLPLIVLSQRPSWITRFAFSEADFIQVFWLIDERDRKTVRSFVASYDFEKSLPPYWSLWYDVALDRSTILRPVPDESRILATFRERLKPRQGETQSEGQPVANLGGTPDADKQRFRII